MEATQALQRPVATAVALLLILPAAAQGVPGPHQGSVGTVESPPATVPPIRGSIVVDGEEDLERPTALSGVRRGNGTAENPYVISNWTIVPTTAWGIRLAYTDAHVRIEHVLIDGRETAVPAGPCADHTGGGLCARSGVVLASSSNVTIQDVRVRASGNSIGLNGNGVRIVSSHDVALETVHVGRDPPAGPAKMADGLEVEGSEDVTASNLTVTAPFPHRFQDSRNIAIRDALFRTPSDLVAFSGLATAPGNAGTMDVTRTVYRNVSLSIDRPSGHLDVRMSRSLVRNGTPSGEGVRIYNSFEEKTFGSIRLCGNTFRGIHGGSLIVGALAESVTLLGNRFVGNDDGPSIGSPDSVVARRNLVKDSHDNGFGARAHDVVAHNNSFVNNGDRGWADGEAFIPIDEEDAPMDARFNWWGHPDGPNVTLESGDEILHRSPGDQLTVNSSDEVDWSHWLAEPPDTGPDAVDCRGPDGPPGPKREPSVPRLVPGHAEP